MTDVEVAAALDKRAASRKKCGGKGRKGGHGYMFNAIFKVPFADDLCHKLSSFLQVVSLIRNMFQLFKMRFNVAFSNNSSLFTSLCRPECSFRCSPSLCLWYLQARRDLQLHCDVIPSHIVEEAGG